MSDHRVYISEVHYDARREDIAEFFEDAGFMVEDVLLPRDKNFDDRVKNRGFAFVTLESERAVAAAIAQLDGRPGPLGRAILVKKAHPKLPSWAS